MELVNTFSVPATMDDAWKLLTDVSRIGPCLPGATVEPLGDDRYAGAVSVKVGPIKVAYQGEARFRTIDAGAREMVLDARGAEKSGKGSAAAVIAVELFAAGADRTDVKVVTNLQVTGKVAQFGRSAMRDVSGRIVDQFAGNLAALLGEVKGVGVPPPTERATDGTGPVRTPDTTPAVANDIDALALLAGPLKRAAVPAAAFSLGVAVSALIGLIRAARTSAKPAAPCGYVHA